MVTKNSIRGASHDSLDGEKLPIELENIFGDNSSKILIVGAPGVGKTTILHYASYRWGKSEIWQRNGFDYVFRIRLKLLLDDDWEKGYTGKTDFSDNLLAYFIHFCLNRTYLDEQINQEQIKILLSGEEKDSCLLLLDGYDEVAYKVNDRGSSAWKIFTQALSFKNVVMTSRPNAISSKGVSEKFGTIIENMRLDDKAIETYVEKNIRNETAEDLISFLRSNQMVLNICNIPINIAMLCIIWQDEDVVNRLKQDFHISDIYSEMITWLGKRYFQKTKSTMGSSLKVITERDILSESGDSGLFRLRKLARRGFENSKLIIDRGLVKDVLGNQIYDIHDFGVLRAEQETSDDLTKCDFSFIHLTFQEYLLAYDLFLELSDFVRDKSAVKFIAEHRNEPRYLMVFKFLAGILSKSKDPDLPRKFWEAIACNVDGVLDLGIEQKVNLFMHLLKQSNLESKGIRSCVFIDKVVKLVDEEICKDISLWSSSVIASGYLSASIREKCEELAFVTSHSKDADHKDVIASLKVLVIVGGEKERALELFRQSYNLDWQVVSCLLELMPKLIAGVESELIPKISEMTIQEKGYESTALGTLGGILASSDIYWEDVIPVVSLGAKSRSIEVLASLGKASKSVKPIEPVLQLLGDKDWRVREAACEALGELSKAGVDAPLEPVLRLFGDEDRWVREAAASALASFNEFGEVFSFLNSQEQIIRTGIKDVFARILSTADYPSDRKIKALSYTLEYEDIVKSEDSGDKLVNAAYQQLTSLLTVFESTSCKVSTYVIEGFDPKEDNKLLKELSGEAIILTSKSEVFCIRDHKVLSKLYILDRQGLEDGEEYELTNKGDIDWGEAYHKMGFSNSQTGKMLAGISNSQVTDSYYDSLLGQISSVFSVLMKSSTGKEVIKEYYHKVLDLQQQTVLNTIRRDFITKCLKAGYTTSFDINTSKVHFAGSSYKIEENELKALAYEAIGSSTSELASQYREYKPMFKNSGHTLPEAACDIEDCKSLVSGEILVFGSAQLSYISLVNTGNREKPFWLLEKRNAFGKLKIVKIIDQEETYQHHPGEKGNELRLREELFTDMIFKDKEQKYLVRTLRIEKIGGNSWDSYKDDVDKLKISIYDKNDILDLERLDRSRYDKFQENVRGFRILDKLDGLEAISGKLDTIFNEKQLEADNLREIKSDVYKKALYEGIVRGLTSYYSACQVINSGMVANNRKGYFGKAGYVFQEISRLIKVPFVEIGISMLGSIMSKVDSIKQAEMVERYIEVASDPNEMLELAKKVAIEVVNKDMEIKKRHKSLSEEIISNCIDGASAILESGSLIELILGKTKEAIEDEIVAYVSSKQKGQADAKIVTDIVSAMIFSGGSIESGDSLSDNIVNAIEKEMKPSAKVFAELVLDEIKAKRSPLMHREDLDQKFIDKFNKHILINTVARRKIDERFDKGEGEELVNTSVDFLLTEKLVLSSGNSCLCFSRRSYHLDEMKISEDDLFSSLSDEVKEHVERRCLV